MGNPLLSLQSNYQQEEEVNCIPLLSLYVQEFETDTQQIRLKGVVLKLN